MCDDDIKVIFTQIFSYLDVIDLINTRINDAGGALVVRDWSHADFTGLLFINNSTLQIDRCLITGVSLLFDQRCGG
ncbi:hypothetical protein ACFL3A_04415 [Pseudomonadota bacterium]